MEIDITDFFNEANPADYFASVAEKGPDAASTTWFAALDAALEHTLLDNEDALAAMRDHLADFGAWEDEEIRGCTDLDLNALLIQLIAGDMREASDCMHADEWDWVAYEEMCANGGLRGNIQRGDDGRVYYYLGV